MPSYNLPPPHRSGDDKTVTPDSWSYTVAKVYRYFYTWTINNFSLLDELGEQLASPPFSSEENNTLTWCLKVSPQGIDEDSAGHVSILLLLVCGGETGVRAKFKISILNAAGKEAVTSKSPLAVTFTEEKPWGCSNFVRRDVLFHEANGLLPDDKLTLVCEVAVFSEFVNAPVQDSALTISVPKSRLKDDLGKLLENELFSDVTLVVNGGELRAHKNVLAARSPVFASLFRSNPDEEPTRLTIPDVDYDVMRELLRFIYTGQPLDLSGVAKDLLVAADFYELNRLKVMCEDALCSSLSIENVVDMLKFANDHKAEQLKAEIFAWIVDNAGRVFETESWRGLVWQEPELAAEVCRAIAEEDGTNGSSPSKRAKYI